MRAHIASTSQNCGCQSILPVGTHQISTKPTSLEGNSSARLRVLQFRFTRNTEAQLARCSARPRSEVSSALRRAESQLLRAAAAANRSSAEERVVRPGDQRGEGRRDWLQPGAK